MTVLRPASWWRWLIVGVAAVVLVSLPALVAAIPVSTAAVSTTTLLQRVQRSADVGYSGGAESLGGLQLPVTTAFSDLTDLFGDRTRLRVWWRGSDQWRADQISTSGETDVHVDAAGVWTWDYEKNTATRTATADVRLPRSADVDPAQLGRRLLSEAQPQEVTALAPRRVAGHDAAGLRLRPDDPNSTIARVDVYADVRTGLPLSVTVYGIDGGRPLMQTAYIGVHIAAPAADIIAFEPPPGAKVHFDRVTDLADAANRFAPFQPAQELAGYPLRQRVEGLGAVGTYGRGVTVLTAVPLPGRISGTLRKQLAAVPTATTVGEGTLLTVGPVSALLTNDEDGHSWVVAGTVTAATLQSAVTDLPTRTRGRR